MILEEHDFSKIKKDANPEDVCVQFENAQISWNHPKIKDTDPESKVILDDVNLDLKKGSMICVVGKVGCGKTTLLQTIMNECVLLRGTSQIAGTIAYVEQEPFIVSATVRENITFGHPFNQERMDRAITLAQLTNDVQIFAKGLDTIIGDRGVNVSGGQKARISLARAIYSDADIMLFDDPLSAVDPKVAKKIFEECVLEGCKDKCVVLVTHQIQFLEQCPLIMLIKDKKPLVGTYQEISASGFNIKEILDSFNNALKAKKDDDDSDDSLTEDEVDIADEHPVVKETEIILAKIPRKQSILSSRGSKRDLLRQLSNVVSKRDL